MKIERKKREKELEEVFEGKVELNTKWEWLVIKPKVN